MKSLKDWRIKENIQNAEWDHIKSVNLNANPEMNAFVSPKIGKLQELIVLKLNETNPTIKSFRDVPPEIRDQFAQAIISSTIETFFGEAESPIQPPQMNQQPTQPQILPQDELQTPAASKG